MKFHATVVFEFSAHDIGEAGKRLNALLEVAEEHRPSSSTAPLGAFPVLSSLAPAGR